MGTMEHMHLYGEAPILVSARKFCYTNIEAALENLYSFAAEQEYDAPYSFATRQTKLQENMERAAQQIELAERPICENSNVVNSKRTSNIAILSRHEVEVLTILKKLPADKLEEYDATPLAHRAGLIHSIPEDIFSIDTATIIDVSFLGLFPKRLLEVIRKYKGTLKQDLQQDFDHLTKGLLSAFIYRAIIIQNIIQYLLVAIKQQIESDCKKRQETSNANNDLETTSSIAPSLPPTSTTSTEGIIAHTPQKLCHANKCRILLAKGILRSPIPCAKNRNMCPGCIIETTRQRKTALAEAELLEATTEYNALAPMLDYITTPVSIKTLRKHLQYLPTLHQDKRDDSIFGVVRYLANSLGLRLNNATAASIDEPMSLLQVKEKWRQAAFVCKCQKNDDNRKIYKDRAFCTTCSFIITHQDRPPMRCSGCLLQDLWGPTGSLCLACQFATIIYRNRFQDRYTRYIEQWIPTLATESEDDTAAPPTQSQRPSSSRTRVSYQDLQKLRQRSLQNSFSEIRSRSSPAENKYVIENITMLQRDLRNYTSCKRNIDSLQTDSISALECVNDENQYSRDNKLTKKILLGDTATCSSASIPPDNSIRQPLAPLDINSLASTNRSTISKRQQKNRDRTIAAKAKRQGKNQLSSTTPD